jgi:hypothetical protein
MVQKRKSKVGRLGRSYAYRTLITSSPPFSKASALPPQSERTGLR